MEISLSKMKMKNLFYPLFIVLALFSSAFIYKSGENPSLEIGAKAPLTDVNMKEVSGKEISLKDQMAKNGLLVIFSCNTCPFVVGKTGSEGWEGRYNELAEKAAEANIGSVLLNSNEAKRSQGDSFEDMVKRSGEYHYKMDYALDKDHLLADAFGARTTPHVFLFNSNFELVYKGAIDDNLDSAAEVKEKWLANAMKNLSEGLPINPNVTKNLGCSIKRIQKDQE